MLRRRGLKRLIQHPSPSDERQAALTISGPTNALGERCRKIINARPRWQLGCRLPPQSTTGAESPLKKASGTTVTPLERAGRSSGRAYSTLIEAYLAPTLTSGTAAYDTGIARGALWPLRRTRARSPPRALRLRQGRR